MVVPPHPHPYRVMSFFALSLSACSTLKLPFRWGFYFIGGGGACQLKILVHPTKTQGPKCPLLENPSYATVPLTLWHLADEAEESVAFVVVPGANLVEVGLEMHTVLPARVIRFTGAPVEVIVL